MAPNYLIQPQADHTADPTDLTNAVWGWDVASPGDVAGLTNETEYVAGEVVFSTPSAPFTPAVAAAEAKIIMIQFWGTTPASDTSSFYAFHDAATVHDGSDTDPGGVAPATGDQFVIGIMNTATEGDSTPESLADDHSVRDLAGVSLGNQSEILVSGTRASDGPGNRLSETMFSTFTVGATPPREFRTFGEMGFRQHVVWKLSGYDLTGAIGASQSLGADATASVTIPDLSGTPADWLVLGLTFTCDDPGPATEWSSNVTEIPALFRVDSTPVRLRFTGAAGTVPHTAGGGTVSATGVNGLSLLFVPPA